jgi:multidrug resistance efflux pump
MSAHVSATGRDLRASLISWRRLRRILWNGALTAVVAGVAALYLNGGAPAFMLRADGLVSRDHVTVAPPFEGRVASVLVHPGDVVERGQKIAVVESATISRTLSELSTEGARLAIGIAQLEVRRRVITETLPMAQTSANQTSTYLNDLVKASAHGLAVNRSLEEMMTASLTALERVATLRAERDALPGELEIERNALNEAKAAYQRLSALYDGGALYANASGIVGSNVAAIGEVIAAGSRSIADIYIGTSFILAYVPDSYLFNIAEGQSVGVKARNVVFNAMIDRILPITETLPDKLQNPNKARARGRLVRIALLDDPNQLPIDQQIEVTGCYVEDCRVGLVQAAAGEVRKLLAGISSTVIAAVDGLARTVASRPI